MGGFRVCAKRCDECLFGPGKIVSSGRARQVLATCKRNDTHFACHKHTLRNMRGEATAGDADVCCRGFYDANPMATNLMRIAARLRAVEFVDEEGNKVTPETAVEEK